MAAFTDSQWKRAWTSGSSKMTKEETLNNVTKKLKTGLEEFAQSRQPVIRNCTQELRKFIKDQVAANLILYRTVTTIWITQPDGFLHNDVVKELINTTLIKEGYAIWTAEIAATNIYGSFKSFLNGKEANRKKKIVAAILDTENLYKSDPQLYSSILEQVVQPLTEKDEVIFIFTSCSRVMIPDTICKQAFKISYSNSQARLMFGYSSTTVEDNVIKSYGGYLGEQLNPGVLIKNGVNSFRPIHSVYDHVLYNLRLSKCFKTTAQNAELDEIDVFDIDVVYDEDVDLNISVLKQLEIEGTVEDAPECCLNYLFNMLVDLGILLPKGLADNGNYKFTFTNIAVQKKFKETKMYSIIQGKILTKKYANRLKSEFTKCCDYMNQNLPNPTNNRDYLRAFCTEIAKIFEQYLNIIHVGMKGGKKIWAGGHKVPPGSNPASQINEETLRGSISELLRKMGTRPMSDKFNRHPVTGAKYTDLSLNYEHVVTNNLYQLELKRSNDGAVHCLLPVLKELSKNITDVRGIEVGSSALMVAMAMGVCDNVKEIDVKCEAVVAFKEKETEDNMWNKNFVWSYTINDLIVNFQKEIFDCIMPGRTRQDSRNKME